MEFNKIAGAVLFTALSAMVISKIGDLLIPEVHMAVHTTGEQEPGKAPPPKPKKKDPPVGQALAQADVKKGAALVKAKCSSCHTWNKGGANKVGPNLWGVVGRPRGKHPGYSYSSGFKKIGGTWTYAHLYHYLPNPSAMVKGTKMTFHLKKWKQRADVIAYLRTQADKPLPLPKVEPAAKTEPAKPEGDKKTAPGKTPAPKKDEAKKTPPTKPAPPMKKAPEKAPAPKKDEVKKTAPDKPAAPMKKEPETKPAPEKKSEAPMKTEPKAPAETKPADKTEPAPDTKKEPEKKSE
jgi:cytochrome c